jgi:hypothetical protein
VLAGPARAAAELVVERSWQHGAWSAHLFRNPDDNRLFCTVESVNDGVRLRLINQQGAGDPLLEVFKPTWALAEDQAQFTLDFALAAGTNYLANLEGASWENGYVYAFKEAHRYRLVVGLIGKTTSIVVRGASGTPIAQFSGSGSRAALDSYEACVASV